MDVRPVATPLQAVDPSLVLAQPGVVRALAAFMLVLVLGGAILWRHDGVVDRSLDASIARPVAALGYGLATHATIVFFGAYAASQLGQVGLMGRSLADVGIWAGLVLLVTIAGLGFTVVGTATVEYGWERHRWYGLVVGATMAGLAALVDPLLGGLLWLVVVSTGIGGRVRVWFHAAEDLETA